jgi:hypothetical protein
MAFRYHPEGREQRTKMVQKFFAARDVTGTPDGGLIFSPAGRAASDKPSR